MTSAVIPRLPQCQKFCT